MLARRNDRFSIIPLERVTDAALDRTFEARDARLHMDVHDRHRRYKDSVNRAAMRGTTRAHWGQPDQRLCAAVSKSI